MLLSPPVLLFLFLIGALVMVVAIVGIVFWYKAHEKDLQVHREMRIREMEHQQKMKELEVELEKAKASQVHERTA